MERLEEVTVVFDRYIPEDLTEYGWMGSPFSIDVEDLADDISGIAVLQEQLIEIHKDETLRNSY
jgi:hypothetical protein